MWEMATECKVDLIVVGEVGRKGPKLAGNMAAGTAIQFMSLNTTIPTLVLKDYQKRKDKPNQAYRWLVCFDTSKHSQKAIKTCLKLMHPQDHLVIVSVMEPPNMWKEDKIVKYVNETCKLKNLKTHFIIPNPKKTFYDMISVYLEEQN